jgi:HlyD family secretion protein
MTTVPTLIESSRAPVAGSPNGVEPTPARTARPHRRRWVAIAIVAALAAVAVGVARYWSNPGVALPYRTAAVERGAIAASVVATGNLNAVVMVLVGSQVSGTIKELQADFNTVVQKGQVIARIDPALFEAAVAQAQADLRAARSAEMNQALQLDQARTNLENARASYAEARAQTAKAAISVADARRTLDRNVTLFERGLIAAADRDTAQTAYDAALAQHDAAMAHEQALASAIQTAELQQQVQAAQLQVARDQIEQKQAVLAQAQINLEHTTIRSPVDGVVVNRAVDVGQTVAASLQAPTLFTIAQDLTRMQVETSVDEADIGRIRRDTPVTFTVDAFPGEVFTGAVSQIRKAPQVAQNVVTYTVVVEVANPAARLLPGMTASVRFVTAQKPDVLKVPNAALRFRPPGATASPSDRAPGPSASQRPSPSARAGMTEGTVWIVGPAGRPAAVAVTLGITDGTFTEVVRGDLAAGQTVLTGLESTAPAAPSVPTPGLRL